MNDTASATVTNISCYCFAPLDNLKELRQELLVSCKEWKLKGTILLSPEGINLFVAGAADSIDRLIHRLRRVPGLESLSPKLSLSEDQPFNRMLVRLKKEIIAFGVDAVRPEQYTSPKIPPRELKRWLDEGRPITLLDTRNDYEVKLGTFKGAIDPQIQTFRSFPDAVRKLPPELKDQPVVMFCTGGIRCEKAGPFMELEGFREIYQLDGGILKYFEECGGDHYAGDCFVFDQRVGVDPALRETSHAVCYACQAPLDEEDLADPRYVESISCPHCFKSEPQRMAERIAVREAALHAATHPLPGSTPRENRRPIHIPASHDRWTLIDALVDLFPQIPAAEWESRCREGRFVNYAGDVRSADHIVRAGERVLQVFPPAVEPEVSTDIRVLHEDEALIVIDKPAPLPMHPGGRYHRNTLQQFMVSAWAPVVPRALHRLDANTTGVVAFATTRHFAKLMQRQLLEGNVEKCYLARIKGHPKEDQFSCDAAISAAPGAHGRREIAGDDSLAAHTRFRVIQRRDDGSSLLEVTPITGRTNQIRLHLEYLGYPIIGDPVYSDHLVAAHTLDTESPPLCLHAWKLAIHHPLSGARMEFVSTPPDWAAGGLSGAD